ncbi:MAG: hypothetical protein ABSE76_00480 [Minisyncoccia bacterium]|jgi:hypothetical protein
MANFDKPLPSYTEEELFQRMDNWDPRYGALAAHELQRRLAVENSASSKRYARWSLGIAIVAILLSLMASGIQIYLAWPK